MRTLRNGYEKSKTVITEPTTSWKGLNDIEENFRHLNHSSSGKNLKFFKYHFILCEKRVTRFKACFFEIPWDA